MPSPRAKTPFSKTKVFYQLIDCTPRKAVDAMPGPWYTVVANITVNLR
jgi:hypothetical protein